ncbi:DUF4421 family protein [Lutibacter holmesii]|uniref:DUF4421 family protein n=1 Tax=Lutibacter holmesii TaxID=1137985 RepID=A0ABW3WMP7_9FLAO
MMKKTWLFFAVTFIFVNSICATNFKKKDTLIRPAQLLDSLIFSEKLDWSLRLVSNFKQQSFRLRNDDNKLKYIPNNPFGIGIGIANQKLIIDIIFNLKTGNGEHTKKFAAEGALVIKRNLFNFALQNVNGYKISNNKNDASIFRSDMSISSIALGYLRILSKDEFTVRGMKSGYTTQDKTTITFGAGGFLIVNNMRADGSIIPPEAEPYFNVNAQIHKIYSYGAGVSAGISSYFALPANFFTSFYIAPGIGLEYKEIKLEEDSYVPSKPIIYKTDFFASAGYNRKKFYIHFTFGTNIYGTSFDFNNTGVLSITKSKLVFGYNIGKINFPRKIF